MVVVEAVMKQALYISIILFCLSCKNGARIQQTPSPELSPGDVVASQLHALQNNDTPETDHGIEIAFNFASPANKENTGPLDRFVSMLHNPLYAGLLNCKDYFIKEHFMGERQAEFFVFVTNSSGIEIIYLFSLSKQKDGTCKNCWMTDGVRPWDEETQEEETIYEV